MWPRLALALVLLCPAAQSARPAPPGAAMVIALDGPIGPANAAYVERSLAAAEQQGAAVAVLRLDTPGGLDSAMRDGFVAKFLVCYGLSMIARLVLRIDGVP